MEWTHVVPRLLQRIYVPSLLVSHHPEERGFASLTPITTMLINDIGHTHAFYM